MDKICEYGCGKPASFQLKNKKWCCSKSYNSCSFLRKKNSDGLAIAHKEGRAHCNFDITNRGWSKGLKKATSDKIKHGYSEEQILCDNSTVSRKVVKNYLKGLSNFKWCCHECELTEWRGKELSLELEHINGKSKDNRIENLKLLCPNCHSQTPTFRGKNVNKFRSDPIHSDEQILNVFSKCGNIRKTLMYLDMAPSGGNYTRIKKLLKKD